MPQYDSIAPDFNFYRSDSIGVSTVAGYIDTLGSDIAVLDMGCGTGKPIAEAIATHVNEYTGVELSQKMAAQFKKGVPKAKCIVSDLAVVNLGVAQYNLCFSWGSLCHLSPQAQIAALTIAARHTKVGGILMFTGGVDKGTCQGSVGPHQIRHCSLGASGYDELLSSLGCEPEFKGEVEDGAAYLFSYVRVAQ